MPHSSGGGSHSSGSHSGSGTSFSSKYSAKSSSFAGSTRYLYYADSKPYFVYANYDIRKGRKLPVKSAPIIFCIIFMLMAILHIPTEYHNPTKLEWSEEELSSIKYETILISDTANVISDKESLRKSLDAFYNETGIMPAVITVEESIWVNNYTEIEHFAYDTYVNLFDDEKHWLILYSSAEKNESGFENWKWEGMQGNDTDPILSSNETNLFNKTLQKCLLQNSKYDVGQAISVAFDTLTPVAMKKYLPTDVITSSFATFIIFGIVLLILIRPNPKLNNQYKSAVVCPETFEDQETCEYCGGIYVVGLHTKCPHCSAPVKAHDFTRNEAGEVTGILN